MQLYISPRDDITVKPERQRQNFSPESILELAASISEHGLLHPVVLHHEKEDLVLVAGWRRIKALEHLWFLGQEVRCNDRIIQEGYIPYTYLGELDPLQAEEIELEENIRREDLDWKDRARTTARIAALRAAQAERDGTSPPTTATVAEEVAGSAEGQFQENTRQDIILGNALRDPKSAAAIAPATSRKEAFKLLKRHETDTRNAALGASLASSVASSLFLLRKGDSLQIMSELPEDTFDVLLTDPPYGIGADEFSDSGGKAAGGHFYDDSYDTWRTIAASLATHSFRFAKREAHAYVFCDIDRFAELRAWFSEAGWKTFRTPLIWVNPGALRAPWPEHGPQRKYQLILFAVKGNRPVTRIYGDVITVPSDPNLGHPAQKPVPLLVDLLRRSVRPGDHVVDPFAGSGSIFPACHEMQCRGTGIEIDDGACGIAAKRIEELK